MQNISWEDVPQYSLKGDVISPFLITAFSTSTVKALEPKPLQAKHN